MPTSSTTAVRVPSKENLLSKIFVPILEFFKRNCIKDDKDTSLWATVDRNRYVAVLLIIFMILVIGLGLLIDKESRLNEKDKGFIAKLFELHYKPTMTSEKLKFVKTVTSSYLTSNTMSAGGGSGSGGCAVDKSAAPDKKEDVDKLDLIKYNISKYISPNTRSQFIVLKKNLDIYNRLVHSIDLPNVSKVSTIANYTSFVTTALILIATLIFLTTDIQGQIAKLTKMVTDNDTVQPVTLTILFVLFSLIIVNSDFEAMFA